MPYTANSVSVHLNLPLGAGVVPSIQVGVPISYLYYWGIPTGGNEGDVYKKRSGIDYDGEFGPNPAIAAGESVGEGSVDIFVDTGIQGEVGIRTINNTDTITWEVQPDGSLSANSVSEGGGGFYGPL